ncbi:MAG: hypothetical protein JXB30_14775 [Anaerolineae bacterium]|nr:hypothetical protein [Anaerolineae bacterium]
MKLTQPVDSSPYKGFRVAVYAPMYAVHEMKDSEWLKSTYDVLAQYLHIGKVYLETHRDGITAGEEVVLTARKFFEDRGIEVAGGITYTEVSQIGYFKSCCYTDPESREKVREVAEYTARLFDEIILDDFFFTNCKCSACIEAKGERSWADFRLALMDEAAEDLVVGPAKKVNPRVRVIIKYPNWYDHFQHCGFNLENGPTIFDGIYTGTETRDPVYNHQHLQPYESYAIIRYFENIAPGRNGGGWVDPFQRRFLDRYAEQLSLTLFAKAREITLFSYGHLLEPLRQSDDSVAATTQVARVAGYVFDRVDAFLGELGRPMGVKAYKPYHSHGEDFLPNYIGMLGVPMDIVPEFPHEEDIIFLAEQAGFDKDIVGKIKKQLLTGKDVMITSGLLRALQGRGIEDLVELEYTSKKALVRRFSDWHDVYPSQYDILIPQLRYATNDTWEWITALDNHSGSGYPILLRTEYADGNLYVLTIPDNPGDLYAYPREVLTRIKKVLLRDCFVYVDSPSHIGLFVYDNDTFIVASFKEHMLPVKMTVAQQFKKLVELQSGIELEGRLEGDKMIFEAHIEPHGYRVFRAE